MTSLEQRILASIEGHGKVLMTGLYKLYPHEKPADIDLAVKNLDAAGWVHYRESLVIGKLRKDFPNVCRSSKQLYLQQNLIDPSS